MSHNRQSSNNCTALTSLRDAPAYHTAKNQERQLLMRSFCAVLLCFCVQSNLVLECDMTTMQWLQADSAAGAAAGGQRAHLENAQCGGCSAQPALHAPCSSPSPGGLHPACCCLQCFHITSDAWPMHCIFIMHCVSCCHIACSLP